MNRLAIVHPSFQEVGGAELLAIAQARVLQDLGLDPEVLTFSWSSRLWAAEFGSIPLRARQSSGKVSHVISSDELHWLKAALAGSRGIIAHNLPATMAVAKLDSRVPRIWYCHEPPRWLHVQTANPYLISHLAEPKALLFSAMRHFWVNRALPARTSRLLDGRRERARREDLACVPRFDVVWANSEYTRDRVRATYGSIPVEVLYPLVELDRPPPRSGLQRDTLRIACVSRLEPVKNVDGLMLAVSMLRKRGLRVSLDIVGVGNGETYLRTLGRVLGLSGVVRFHGRVSARRLSEILNGCDVFALVPFDEPFGMVYPEAMLRGLLVVAPNHGGPREVLDDSRLGFSADPLCVASIAESLERAFRLTDAAADDLRDAARTTTLARFSRPVIRRRMKKLLVRAGIAAA